RLRPNFIRSPASPIAPRAGRSRQRRSREWVCARWRGERAASSPAWVTTSVHKCSDWCRAAWSLVSRRACFVPRHSLGACSLRLCVCCVKVVFRFLKKTAHAGSATSQMSPHAWEKQLREEGFSRTYVWQDHAHASYPDHTHATETAHIILEGEMTLTMRDRKSTRLNSSHGSISYAVFCWKKRTQSDRL